MLKQYSKEFYGYVQSGDNIPRTLHWKMVDAEHFGGRQLEIFFVNQKYYLNKCRTRDGYNI